MSIRRRSTRLPYAAVAIFLVATAACGSGSGRSDSPEPGSPPDAITPAQALAEYDQESGLLTLAAGWEWKDGRDIPAKAEDQSAIVYGRGFGRQKADFYWLCSWQDQLLHKAPSAAERDAALAQMNTFKTTYAYTDTLGAPEQAHVDELFRTAGLGDLAPTSEDFTGNCAPH